MVSLGCPLVGGDAPWVLSCLCDVVVIISLDVYLCLHTHTRTHTQTHTHTHAHRIHAQALDAIAAANAAPQPSFASLARVVLAQPLSGLLLVAPTTRLEPFFCLLLLVN